MSNVNKENKLCWFGSMSCFTQCQAVSSQHIFWDICSLGQRILFYHWSPFSPRMVLSGGCPQAALLESTVNHVAAAHLVNPPSLGMIWTIFPCDLRKSKHMFPMCLLHCLISWPKKCHKRWIWWSKQWCFVCRPIIRLQTHWDRPKNGI